MKKKDNDPLKLDKDVTMRAHRLALETTQSLEKRLKDTIKDGKIEYADLLSMKTILDCNYRALCEIQEIDQRMRRLICMDDFDVSQGKAVAFFDEREISE